MVADLVFYRGNKQFTKKFSLTQDGSDYDLSLLTDPVTVTWHFKNKDAKKKLNWTGSSSGANNNIVSFLVPADFFDTAILYDSQVEVKDDSGLLLHNEEIFEVEIKEPAGVTTDT